MTDEAFIAFVQLLIHHYVVPLPHRRRRFSIQFILQSQIIRDHRDKLRIGGLTSIVLNGVPKVAVEGIHVAAVPRDLDGVADGTLHAAGCD